VTTTRKARSRPAAGHRRQNLPFRLLSLHREVPVLLKIGSNEKNLDISENRRRGKNGPHVIEKKTKKDLMSTRTRDGTKLEKETGGIAQRT
jgi:hypothetical protein